MPAFGGVYDQSPDPPLDHHFAQELHSASHLAMTHNQQLPPKGRTRPHSLDIGVYEHQGQREAAKQAKGRGVYKSGSGTFMFASTSMSAALDNLQFYPKATNAQLTPEHRATIRETVVSQLAPLRSFPKAHTFPGVMVEPYSPASSQPDRRSADFRRSADYRRSADFPPFARPPLPSSPSAVRPPVPFGSTTTWSPSAQIALAAPRASTDTALAKLTREQQIANAASSSFFSPTVARPAAKPVASNLPAVPPTSPLLEVQTLQAEGDHAAELANAAASAFFAPAQLRHVQSHQHHGQMPVLKTVPSHRASPQLHGNPPTAKAAAKPQFTRATRGSFEQPQTRARGSFEQPQTRARGSFEQPQTGARGSFEQVHSRARNSFEQSQPRCRNSFEEAHSAAGNSPQVTGRSSFDQLQARSSYDQLHTRHNLSALGAISEHPNTSSVMPPAHQIRHPNAFGQGPGQPNYASGLIMDQFTNSQANLAGFHHHTARASCDYPHAVANARASASAPRAQALYTAQLDRAASSGASVSRSSLVASREFARLDEATKRQAAIAALGARPFPPNQRWPEQGVNVDAPNALGSPFGQWPAQPAADVPPYQPHALQLHALNTLHAMNMSAQSSQGQLSHWSQKLYQPQAKPVTMGFPPQMGFPPTLTFHPHPLPLQHNGMVTAPARHSQSGREVAHPPGTWGAHLDSGANIPTPRNSGSARGQSFNPFLQPQSTFSIREAKLQLQNPTPRDADDNPHGEKSIPRVDTFASNLHDSWGAHAQHDSPPANESTLNDPPRLSTESLRSSTSAASKASSGASRANCLFKQGSGRYHHGYGYDPSSDGWKVDCSSGTQKSFSTYTVAKPESNGGGGIIAASKELLAEAANASRSADASTRRTSQDGSSGISPLLDILVDPDTPLAKTRRVLETLTFLAANPAIAFSICEQGGIALLLQVVADPHDGVQLEAAKALQALMMHQCAQVGFDQCDGVFKVAPMLSEHRDPITHLAGLHILASVVYSRNRSQDTMSEQLQQAGLYDAALALLTSHSHSAGQDDSSTHKDTLDWLEASQVGSPMAPLPEDHPVNLEAKGSVGSAKGSSSQTSSKLAFHPDCAHQASRPLLMTARTMPLPSPKAVPATSNSLSQSAKAFPPEQEVGASGANLAGSAAAASAQGLEEDAERLSGDVTVADQVVLAALEVLYKLSSSKQHLQSFRPSLLMEAVTAQLQHGTQTRGLTRSIQLLQVCSQEPSLLDEFAHSECISELVRTAQGSGYVATLASSTLGAMAQSDAVRSVILQGEGTKPIVLMLARTNLALPGALYLLSCLAEFGDSRHSMLLAGIVPALLRLAERTRDKHTCASATSLLRLLTNSTDRRSTEGIHGGGLNVAGNFRTTNPWAGTHQTSVGGHSTQRHAGHAFQGFFQL
ncbi:MAG: hypothetical protein FRX49_00519 [Trebouxia sp. A1-2]|nr:MAG: hypothetical protein FRX49_00519 [Trebouxia sp. A1-2]